MALPPQNDFTGRDTQAEYERSTALMRSLLPELTDLNFSDWGAIDRLLQSSTTDALGAYINQIFNRGFPASAWFRQDLIELGKIVGYLPTLMSAATTRLRFTRKEGVSGPVNIPVDTAFGRADGRDYLTVAASIIPAEGPSAEVDAIQGIVVELEIEPADFQILDATRHPRASLGVGVAAGSVQVSQGDGPLLWTQVDSFFRSSAGDRHFLCELNGDTDAVWLVLGDGVEGQGVPNEPLNVRFIRTAGAAGNCGSGLITVVPDALANLITCTNIQSATGGAASETADQMRRRIPAVTAAQRRMVTPDRPDRNERGDYSALIEHLPGVLHCQAIDRNYGSEWPHYYMTLFVVPAGGGPMTTLLKNQIWAECAERGHLGAWRERYILRDAVERPMNASLRIGILEGYDENVVRAAVLAAWADLFSPENQEIGGTATFADMHRVVSAVAGVSWVEFTSPTGDTSAGIGGILTPGTTSVAVG